MARPGVGFEDIAGAADALLDAGERPTTERVRGFLGRGSPNTIGPLLVVVGTSGQPVGGKILDGIASAKWAVARHQLQGTSGTLSAAVRSSGRFFGECTKRGRLLVGKWAVVRW